ncbi:MAG: Smr/MutS family protein [Cytophagales bacterium]|nr:Smr/MutS family protein [Cytophagales bacterium]
MLYPEDIEEKLGFDKIRQLLKKHCAGQRGKYNVDRIKFSSNPVLVQKLIKQTGIYMKMLEMGEKIPSLNYPEVDPILEKLKIQGVFLEIHEVVSIYKTLEILNLWQNFLKEKEEYYPEISLLAKKIEVDQILIKKIDSCIDEKGAIRSNASPELRKIRSEIYKNEQIARKTLDRIMRDSKKSEISPEDSSLTIRNGRLVIPVKAEHKRSFKGFVHDASASGNIIFIEPSEVLDINNDIRELSYREKREIIRILTDLTEGINAQFDQISGGSKLLGIIDLINAKAKLSSELDAAIPEINKYGELEWHQAVNPVLKRALQKQQKELVPLDIHLDKQKRILLISGPNAGGKSVCLQTVGLLQYMYQCGLPIPVLEGSRITLYKSIFIDIGDEQSMDDDLSTYSSHLKSMNFFLKNACKDTLFLIDEFGAGTDPQFGGAIAEAILEQLAKSKSHGIITTHYNNLKKIADEKEGLVNGRMRFDVKKLEPIYQLEIGKPGSSFALEIAGKIGLDKQIIQSAKKKVGTNAVEMDRLLTELEDEKQRYEEENKRFENQKMKLDKTIQSYSELKGDIENRKREILNEAKREAKNLLKETNQKVETLIREIKENKAEKEATKKSREEVKKFEKKINIEKIRTRKADVKVIDGPIVVGDLVRIKGQQSFGEIVKILKKDAEVLFGDLKSIIKMNRLEKISKGAVKKIEKENASSIKGIDINTRKANFSHDLDLRGKRSNEALVALTGFMDDAILFGVQNIRIIHGKGDGILREVLRKEIKTYKEVKACYDEHADRGGAGITVVELI